MLASILCCLRGTSPFLMCIRKCHSSRLLLNTPSKSSFLIPAGLHANLKNRQKEHFPMNGDKKIIDILNDLLAGELTAVDQYLIHGEMYSDMGYPHLAEKSLHESDHERQHARALIQRIQFLEGVANVEKRNPVLLGKTVSEMLKADLEVEYHVVGELKKAIAACEKSKDYVSRDMLLVQLEDTEMDHAYYLEKQLRLLEAVGLSNYLQSQMKPGHPN
ncbi:bacterioferritin [Zoogloea oleivorans]|nr:bacterioferritin [Zoogloea oleivorans]